MTNDTSRRTTTKAHISRSTINGSATASNNGDYSDDSRMSIGNNSFGFNFDSEECNPSPVNSDAGHKSDEDNGTAAKDQHQKNQFALAIRNAPAVDSPRDSVGGGVSNISITHNTAAADVVSQLQGIAAKCGINNSNLSIPSQEIHELNMNSAANQSVKRKASIDSSQGYKSDDDDSRATSNLADHANSSPIKMDADMMQPMQQPSQEGVMSDQPRSKKKRINNVKREERNAREKERSYRITTQINELRNLLSTGGVIVPKGTKNAVLSEAANYIRVLQQHQFKSEIHRQQLIQQMQMIGGGQLGPQAASAIRHVAAQNGVWSLGSFGGAPPRSAMTTGDSVPSAVGQSTNVSNASSEQTDNGVDNSSTTTSVTAATTAPNNQLMKDIGDHDYRFVFNSCAIGMAIASMGGAFIDCNKLFIQLSEYTKQEICGLTIFNLTAKHDLQNAFDLISQMISPPADSCTLAPSCMLRGNMKTRADLGLNITLIKDEGGIAKCFCVTLINTPNSQYEAPVHATADAIRGGVDEIEKDKQGNLSKPAFMTG